jgi:hydroxyacylglutathione hydrolase
METPGHTLGHVVYYGANSLFCGDTLFSAGCGRLFEGSCEQMFSSLQRLSALPPETRVYCTHEYTEHNLRFAHMLNPDNPALIRREQEVLSLRAQDQPSLPSTIAIEHDTNPFLRCDQPEIRAAVQQLGNSDAADPLSVFCAMRKMRNTF